ncbi:methylated-DNA--[protein]-cysteine S-methyltransferase [Deltaproteobacteria bacterium OttesenSCG-928-K17]|nr:methylated-DNA--[protein]-cysteine S-methyltransferase [Deltaproteobacteria bacterium OttesenSCG-928-K17]
MKPLKKDVKGRPLKNIIFFKTDFGEMAAAELDGLICDVFLTSRTLLSNVVEKETAVLRKARRQILEYLGGRRRKFDLPLNLNGSEFQRTVLEAVRRIPYGETRSYKQIAEDVGHPRAARAVGTANRLCRISIIVPCHRVIRSNGSAASFGDENCLRDYLLKLEADNR